MEDEWKYICPRPRRRRACNPCKERKIRCLRGEKSQDVETCRRCAKLGISCNLGTDARPSTRTGNTFDRYNMENERPFSCKDVVSRLFQNEPTPKDELSELCDLHRQAFQTSHHNPSQAPPFDSSSTKSNVVIEDADTVLDIFRNRQHYFPFVSISKNASASSMAVDRPFLLMSILNVCSSRVPSLQKKTDERFRRVLSERVVFHDEKSLDYLQGLLVYIAWYPFHFKPLSNQVSQFLQIALNMCSELKLNPSHSDKESRDAYLGCCNLSSIFCTGLDRPRSGTSTCPLESTFDELAIPHEQGDIQTQHTELQLLSRRMVHYEAELDSESIGSGRNQTIREKIDIFDSKVKQLTPSTPIHQKDNSPINLSHLFLRAKVLFLPLKAWGVDSCKNRDKILPAPPTLDMIEAAISCFQEIRNLLEAFLALPVDQYLCFTTREWFQLILTTRMASQTCFLFHANAGLEWNKFQAKTRAKMATYLKRLSQRMEGISASTRGGPPDIFAMFRSVLDLLVPKYAPHEVAPRGPSSSQDAARILSTKQARMDTELPCTGSSSCPILNGSIKCTDFWRASEETQSSEGSTDSCDLGLSSEDGLFNGSRDWLNVFSQWVVDLNDGDNGA